MVGDSSEDSVPWQVEFFRRPETVSGGDFDGNCVFVCGSHFDWAGVFLLAMAFSIPTICGMDSSSVHRPPMEATTGSLLLVAGQQERFVVPLLVTGLQDPLVTVILVVAPDDWCLLWSTASGGVASTEWQTVAEWKSSRGSDTALLLLVRGPAPPLPPHRCFGGPHFLDYPGGTQCFPPCVVRHRAL